MKLPLGFGAVLRNRLRSIVLSKVFFSGLIFFIPETISTNKKIKNILRFAERRNKIILSFSFGIYILVLHFND